MGWDGMGREKKRKEGKRKEMKNIQVRGNGKKKAD